jgi:hypothetical protein
MAKEHEDKLRISPALFVKQSTIRLIVHHTYCTDGKHGRHNAYALGRYQPRPSNGMGSTHGGRTTTENATYEDGSAEPSDQASKNHP